MKISAEILNAAKVVSWLKQVEKDDIPAAIVKALNNTAYMARADVIEEMKQVFDRPTPYTLRSVLYEKATKEKLYSRVYINDEKTGTALSPLQYLMPEVEGGERNKKGMERLLERIGAIRQDQFLIPWKAPLNQYGNVQAGLVQRILSGLQAQQDDYQNSPVKGQGYKGTRTRRRVVRRYFTTDRHGVVIIWERNPRRAVPLFVSVKKPHYKTRLRFNDVVRATADRVLWSEFMGAFDKSVKI